LILLFIGYLGLSNLVYAQTDCLPSQVGCTFLQNFTAQIVLPNYPGCPITAFYQLRYCENVAQITNVSLTLDYLNNTSCSRVLGDVLNASFSFSPTNSAIFFRDFWSSVETEIAKAYFETAIAGSPANVWSCNNPKQKLLTASFYRGACLTYCVGQTSEGALKFSTGACSSVCCVKNMSYCIDEKGIAVITESTSLMPGGSACSSTPPSDSCPEGTFFQSPCIETCK
jgi:hypothetical protein